MYSGNVISVVCLRCAASLSDLLAALRCAFRAARSSRNDSASSAASSSSRSMLRRPWRLCRRWGREATLASASSSKPLRLLLARRSLASSSSEFSASPVEEPSLPGASSAPTWADDLEASSTPSPVLRPSNLRSCCLFWKPPKAIDPRCDADLRSTYPV